ncbi:MAG: IS66 family transposase [Bacteroidetes bacterium]|nr:IS66 family transposase [Bacteroidota bacterium]
MGKDKLIFELIKKVESLTLRIQQLETSEKESKILCEKIVGLEQENIALKAENIELKSRLNSNSRNSSKPPSSDGYQKKPALPKKKKGKQGGQKGHKGRTLHQVDAPDKIIGCRPGNCSCGHEFSDNQTELSEKRQVFDLPEPRLEVTEYQIHKATCPTCGKLSKGAAPESVNAPVQYGNGVKAYVVLLNVHFKLPFKKIQLLFSDLFGYPINESTICSAGGQCYQKLEKSEEIIKSKISKGNVAHADETGMRVVGKLHWLHTATTLLYTYLFIHEKRGKGALKSEKSILGKFTGWLVHDCWGSYFKFETFKHALCGAHILRELEGLIETKKTKWAKIFKTYLMGVYEMPFEERVKRRQHIESRYNLICNIGEKSEPPPIKTPGKRGRYKRTKGRNLVERLIREKDAVLAFAFNEDVPFTNNLAERDIRPAKVKQKISNCFRTFKGAQVYARIEGFVSTARKQNRNVFSELCATFDGHNFITD